MYCGWTVRDIGLGPRLLLIIDRKSYIAFQMTWKSSTLDDLEGDWQSVRSAILATAWLLVLVRSLKRLRWLHNFSSFRELTLTLCYSSVCVNCINNFTKIIISTNRHVKDIRFLGDRTKVPVELLAWLSSFVRPSVSHRFVVNGKL